MSIGNFKKHRPIPGNLEGRRHALECVHAQDYVHAGERSEKSLHFHDPGGWAPASAVDTAGVAWEPGSRQEEEAPCVRAQSL